jgi:hypothetical protein
MRVLFDQGVPAPLRNFIDEQVDTCHERGWSHLSNGDLISQAESEYDVFIITDKNLRYQQNLKDRKIAILVLPTARWPIIKPHGLLISSAVKALQVGDFEEWKLPA